MLWLVDGDARARDAVDELQMALARRRPEPGLIHHSDQGGQYVSLAFGRAARDAGIAVSMGSRGDADDNAVAETFFATLKKELVNRRSWPSRLELQSAVFEYIEAFYNRQRRHSTLGMLSPVTYEQLRLSRSVVENNRSNNNNQQQHPKDRGVTQLPSSPISVRLTADAAIRRTGQSCARPLGTRWRPPLPPGPRRNETGCTPTG